MNVTVSAYEARTVDIMMGYLWYDIIQEMSSGKVELDTIGHHIMGVTSHLSTRLSNNGAASFYR